MLQEHLGYLSDAVRTARFAQALRATLRPGDRVADLGCGTGILGLLALQAGAGHVDAVDETPMIEIAREAFARAGLAHRARFHAARAQQLELPERVDLAVCDHVGFLGFDYGVIGLLRDSRRRLLKPGGTVMPARLALQLAPVESERCRALADGWRADAVPPEFRWLQGPAVNARHGVELTAGDLLGPPADLGTIDLRAEEREFFSWTVELRLARGGMVHGLGGWFDCELCEGVRMSNSPLAAEPIRREQAFLPIAEPVRASAGDALRATLMARPAEDLIAWTVEFPAAGRRFRHSTWEGMALSSRDLLRSDPDRVPRPGRAGIARGIVLGYADGRRSAREIEQAVLREHPGLFPSAAEISRFVAQVLARDAP